MDFDFELFYSRHFPLSSIGKENQKRLQNFTVLIAGIGGLGTVSADLLASFGVGRIKLVDYDVVEQSNLARQKIYTLRDIGKAKVDAAKEYLERRNPSINVEAHAVSIDGLSVKELCSDTDLVIDGLDRFSSRRALHAYCKEKKIPYIFAGAVAENANLMTLTFKPDTPCLQCAFGNLKDNPDNTCEFMGVHPSILSITASIQVTEAIRVLLGQDPILESKIMLIDLELFDFEKVTVRKNPNCTECNRVSNLSENGTVGEVKQSTASLNSIGNVKITSLCGRDTFIVNPDEKMTWDFGNVKRKINEKWKIEAKGESAISFINGSIKVSLLKSGVMTIRGAELKANALSCYESVIRFIKSN